MYRYYYYPDTGIFQSSSSGELVVQNDLPYIERSEPFFFSDYRLDLQTGELIYEPVPRRPSR